MKTLTTILFSITLLMAPPAFAESSEDRAANIESRLAETKARLNLTDEQIEQLEPILLDGIEKRLAVMEKHGISRDSRSSGKKPGIRQLRAIKREMNKIEKETESQLAGVLDEAQLEEYRKIQEEQRAEMRARIKAKRG